MCAIHSALTHVCPNPTTRPHLDGPQELGLPKVLLRGPRPPEAPAVRQDVRGQRELPLCHDPRPHRQALRRGQMSRVACIARAVHPLHRDGALRTAAQFGVRAAGSTLGRVWVRYTCITMLDMIRAAMPLIQGLDIGHFLTWPH